MSDFYSDMQQMTRELLASTLQGGLGQGLIELTHFESGEIDPNAPWIPVIPSETTERLGGAVSGVSEKLVGVEVGGTVVLGSDRVAICEVPLIEYSPGDTLSIDGKPVHIISFEKIPAAGVTSAVQFIIRG